MAACVALSAVGAAPAHAADGDDRRHAAEHLRQRQRASPGRLRRQRERRVLHRQPAGAGLRRPHRGAATQQRGRRSTVFGYTAAAAPLHAAAPPPAVSGDGSAGNPFVLTANYDATMHGRRRARCSRQQSVVYVNGTTGRHGHLRHSSTAIRRRRPCSVGSSSRPTSTSPATTPASGFFSAGPPRQVGGSTRSRTAAAQPRRDHAVDALPGGGSRRSRTSINSIRRRAAGLQRHRRPGGRRQRRGGAQWDFARAELHGSVGESGRLALQRARARSSSSPPSRRSRRARPRRSRSPRATTTAPRRRARGALHDHRGQPGQRAR